MQSHVTTTAEITCNVYYVLCAVLGWGSTTFGKTF